METTCFNKCNQESAIHMYSSVYYKIVWFDVYTIINGYTLTEKLCKIDGFYSANMITFYGLLPPAAFITTGIIGN